MISTTWTDAPTGFSGSGGVAVRPAACGSVGGTWAVLVPAVAPAQGSGLPVPTRLRPIDERGTAHTSYLQEIAGIAAMSTTTENNVTTLGIHPPGRPQS